MSADTTRIAGVDCLAWSPEATTSGSPAVNFGDAIGALVVRELVQRAGITSAAGGGRPHRLVSIGSVLHFTRPGDVVWGSGINGKVFRQEFPLTLDVRSVRGPLTRSVLLARGIPVPEVYGDPALLLPRLFPELVPAVAGTGTVCVPNLNEMDRFVGDEVLSPLGDPMQVVGQIATAGFVTGTSLHAMILADALGIPSRPIVSQVEHPFKYIDYYAGTGRPDIAFARTVEEAVDLGPVPPVEVDLDRLETVFPYDLWSTTGAVPTDEQQSFAELSLAGERVRTELLGQIPWNRIGDETAQALLRSEQLAVAHRPHEIPREEAAALGWSLPHLRTRATRDDLELSVIVPTHNVAPWIGETLQSILSQDVERMEVIVVDDRSTDGTAELVAEVAAGDPRVTLLHSASRGGGVARNIGLDHARAPHLVFCDGDDIVPDGAYAAMLRSAQESGSDIVFGDYLKFSPTDTWRPTDSMRSYARPGQGRTIVDEPELMYSRPCWNKVFSRGFWESSGIRFPNVPRSNDIVPMVSAYLRARRVDIVRDVVYLYRERPGGTSMTAQSGRARSLLSYLAQELTCARLVISAHQPPLDRVFSSLIYERDAYFHVRKFLEGWEPAESDDEVVRAVRSLLAHTARPPRSTSGHKSVMLRLAARGELPAAQALARRFGAVPVLPAERISGWQLILDRAAVHELDVAGHADLARAMSDDLLAATQDQRAVEVVGATDTLIATLRRSAAGADVVAAVPELGVSPTPELLAALALERTEVAPVLTGVAGGDVLVLTGRVRARTTLVPALYDARHPASPVTASAVTWTDDGEGGYAWEARFPAASLPLHRELRPVLSRPEQRVMISLDIDTRAPEYSAMDAFLFDPERGMTVTRRRHWTLRAGRRALIRAGEVIRSEP